MSFRRLAYKGYDNEDGAKAFWGFVSGARLSGLSGFFARRQQLKSKCESSWTLSVALSRKVATQPGAGFCAALGMAGPLKP